MYLGYVEGHWRLKYQLHGHEKLISLGAYPDVTLKRARPARCSAQAHFRRHRSERPAENGARCACGNLPGHCQRVA
jgi:hypothetical protein